MSRGIFEHAINITTLMVLLMAMSGTAVAQTSAWTLESTVQRAIEVAPEQHAAESEVEAWRGRQQQAGRWNNPSIALSASDALSKNEGKSGFTFSELTIIQSLPINGRIGAQQRQAEASLHQAQTMAADQALMLEYLGSQAFHQLQLTLALYTLAQQRLESAEEFQRIGLRREQAGDLSKLERLRLDLVRENAMQMVTSSEGKMNEALSHFRTLLNLGDEEVTVTPLEHLPQQPDLPQLESSLEQHPGLMAARQGVEVARHGVAVARTTRLPDPELWLGRGRQYIGNHRETVTSFGVQLSVPLWNNGRGTIDTAQANRQKAQYQLEAQQRQLSNSVNLAHMHLGHLIEQVQEYRTKVLEPAGKIFELSRSGFAAGEVEILPLVDAVNSYYDSRGRYLELLQQCWLEAAALRRAAGLSLLTAQSPNFEGAAQ